MSLARVNSRAISGVQAPEVIVEVHLTRGLPAFSIVGLPEAAVRESRDRVRSAILNSGFEFPRSRITVNLAPADLPKEGGRFDLPIAVGILAASGQVPAASLEGKVFVGELALNGELRKTRGVLVTVIAAYQHGEMVIAPLACGEEAALLVDAEVGLADSLLAVAAGLNGRLPFLSPEPAKVDAVTDSLPSLNDIRGQAFAKRALLIAAVGHHNILFYGSPGTGKTMLANRLPGLLPDLSLQESLDVAAIHSISEKGLPVDAWGKRPFRAPHHSASSAAIVGGGAKAMPGEISLAHHGVLFLDELPEFDGRVLEALREPLESGAVTISRAAMTQSYHANILLVAAMNPCSDGYYGDADPKLRAKCSCTSDQIRRYRSKISGPLLDRIDMHVEVPRVPFEVLSDADKKEQVDMDGLRQRVVAARACQIERQGNLNSEMSVAQVETFCALGVAEQQLLRTAVDKLGLSARAYHRVLKVARSIADLAHQSAINAEHLAQAIQFRSFDREV